MDFGLQNIQDYSKDLLWMLKTLKQIEKEFYNEKWTFRKPINSESAFNDVVIQLKPKLKELILQRDDGYYKQLLYKIDISKSQIAKAVAIEKDVDFVEVLTKLIIRRCLQKVLIRNYYKGMKKNFLRRA